MKPTDVLDRDPWFSNLPESLQTDLLAIGVVGRYPPGKRLFSRAIPPDGLYGLLEGTITVFNEVAPGQDGVLAQFDAPAWFGDISFFDGLGRTHSVEALQASLVLHLPQRPLLELLETRPQAWRSFALLLTQKLRTAFVILDELTRIPADMRLARRLLIVASGYGVHDVTPNCVLTLCQDHLAQMLGMSRAAVNPILRKLNAAGVIKLAYGKIEILEPDVLKKLAGHDHWQPTTKHYQARPAT